METQLQTFSERVAWAIERSKKTLQQLGAEIGCSHVALSYWQSGRTQTVKADLLQSFADATGTELRWLLRNEGPALAISRLRPSIERVATALAAMERFSPYKVEMVIRMIEAAAQDDSQPPE